MTNINITNFRKDIYNLLEQTIKYNEPINISTKNGNAVVLSEEDYRNLIATLEIESNKKLKEKILEGMKEDLKDCVPESEVEWQQVYKIVYTKKAIKDIEKIKQSSINKKAKSLIEVIRKNPYQTPPPYEKLLGDLERFIFKKVKYTTQIIVSSI